MYLLPKEKVRTDLDFSQPTSDRRKEMHLLEIGSLTILSLELNLMIMEL